jgi:hypothetical protein
MMGGGMRSLVMGRWCSHVMGCSRMCYLVMRRLSVDGFMVCCLRMRNLAMRRLRMRTFVMFCFWACAFVVHCFGLSALVMYGRGLCTLVMHGGRLSSGVGSNYGVRAALIDRVTLVAVISSFLLVRALRWSRLETTILRGRLFRGGRSRFDSIWTIKADVIIDRFVVDHRTVNVGVVDDRRIHVPHRCVIPKDVAVPSAAVETGAIIAVAIVNASVISDVRTPITAVPKIVAIRKSPVTRSPKVSRLRNLNPRAGDPKITVLSVAPVAGTPKITLGRARRLLVSDERWWRNCNRDILSEQARRCAQQTGEEEDMSGFHQIQLVK